MWELESQDYLYVIWLLTTTRIMETFSVAFIWRWKINIKRDVEEFNMEAVRNKYKPK
jgi:hypothetical protein